MLRYSVLPMLLLTLAVAPAAAQNHGGTTRGSTAAPKEAEQFAFLVGQWEVKVLPKVSSLAARIHGVPSLLGSWKGWRALDGYGIEDELRIVDGSGNPSAFSHTVRFYDATQRRWAQSSLDVYRGQFTTATAVWSNGEMQLRSTGRDAEGKAYVQKARFHAITPTSFKYEADRSTDGEKTWERGVLRMEARRVSASAPR